MVNQWNVFKNWYVTMFKNVILINNIPITSNPNLSLEFSHRIIQKESKFESNESKCEHFVSVKKIKI